MRHVMVMNSKGGCGKSTIATNIASYFATEGYKVALADYDPQRTSLDWLALRPEDLPQITGVAGLRRRPARRAARHRGAGHRRAGAHARLGDE